MAVCTTADFETDDDGRLQVAICGDPDAEDHDASGCGNALRRDTDCGLFVPSGGAALLSATRTVAPNAGVPAGGLATAVSDDFDFQVCNPSSCQPAIAQVISSEDIRYELSPNSGARYRTKLTQDLTPAGLYDDADTTYNDGAAVRTYFQGGNRVLSFALAAGECRTVRVGAQLANIAGTVRVVEFQHRVQALVVVDV